MTTADKLPADAQDVLDFWFMPQGHESYGKWRGVWFEEIPAFDNEVRARFGKLVERALSGDLVDWEQTPRGRLARILLLDQFTRNIYRHSARAFSGDPLALTCAQRAIATNEDHLLLPVERCFIYLPFEHCEDIGMQEISVSLFLALLDQHSTLDIAGAYDYALRHETVIRRFGRFPQRNAVLFRESTLEEKEFLKRRDVGF